MRHSPTAVLTACACLLLASQAPAAAPLPSLGEHVRSGGVPVRVERFLPTNPGRRPAVLLLPGADGMQGGPHYRAIARGLADRGFVTVLVYYFDRTATDSRDVPALLERFGAYFAEPADWSSRWRAVQDTFELWLEAVEAALADLRRHQRVDPGRVAVAGVSLGAFLATSAAVRFGGVRCVASLFGGLPRSLHGKAAQMPPTLLIHSDADRLVPLRETHDLRALLEREGRHCEVKIYRGIGHGFATPKGRDWGAMIDAQLVVTAFLERHLRPVPAAEVVPVERETPPSPQPSPQPEDGPPPAADESPGWSGLVVSLLVAACATLAVALLLGIWARTSRGRRNRTTASKP